MLSYSIKHKQAERVLIKVQREGKHLKTEFYKFEGLKVEQSQ